MEPMSYRLEPGEPTGEGLARIVGEEIDAARDDLGSEETDRHEAVHEARKRFKKIRAVLRLARGRLGDDLYSAENTWYRDAGRALSRVRDAQALVETAEELGGWAEATGRVEDAAVEEEIAVALAERRERVVATSDLDARAAAIATALDERRQGLDDWPLVGEGEDAAHLSDLGEGLGWIYGKGRAAFEALVAGRPADGCWSGDDHAVHEWRKRVKDLWYVGRILEPVWPAGLEGWVEALDDLSDLLGDHHDLAVLGGVLLEERLVDPEVARTALATAVERQVELLAEAIPLGRRIYAEDRQAHVARMLTYWDAWNTEHLTEE